MISGCDLPDPLRYANLDLGPAVLVMVMIIFTSIWLMKPIAANYSSNVNRLAMMGVTSSRAKPITAENTFRRS